MENQPSENQAIANLNIIRSETVLSRYPIHRLSKKGTLEIEIRKHGEKGEVTFQWRVSPNRDFGEPGPLAYKLDTLIINRRIENMGRPVPKVLKLGSYSEICRELEIQIGGKSTENIKEALLQNAFAAITAKLVYRGNDGTERTFKFGDTRYGVIFSGEKLPGGQKADAIYIVLHDLYRELLNSAPTRPLDFDYLKNLPPMAQRFYELLSYQIYATLKHRKEHAKYLYSEFCTYAPQTRYFTFEKVKKQMYKVHAPHKQCGYIEQAEFQETIDGEGKPDWIMMYKPGPKAQEEFRLFTRKGRDGQASLKDQLETLAAPTSPPPPQPTLPLSRELAPEEEALVLKLCGLNIAEATARELVQQYPEAAANQLKALPYRDKSTIRDLPSWLIKAIKENFSLPDRIIQEHERAERFKRERARRAYEEARQSHEDRHRDTYSEYLEQRIAEIKRSHPEAYNAFEEQTREEREKTLRVFRNRTDSPLAKIVLVGMICEYFHQHPLCPILDFWEWDQQHNPEPFRLRESDFYPKS